MLSSSLHWFLNSQKPFVQAYYTHGVTEGAQQRTDKTLSQRKIAPFRRVREIIRVKELQPSA